MAGTSLTEPILRRMAAASWGALASVPMGDDVYLLQLGAGHLAGAFSYGLRNFEVRHYLVLPTRDAFVCQSREPVPFPPLSVVNH
jgi:hypothetical protein